MTRSNVQRTARERTVQMVGLVVIAVLVLVSLFLALTGTGDAWRIGLPILTVFVLAGMVLLDLPARRRST